MIYLIWSGKGFLVAVITFGFSLISQLITDYATGGEAYWKAHKWPLAISLFFSATACSMIGRALNRKEARLLIDPRTGKGVILKESNTFFFIPMTVWGPILAGFGLVALATEVWR